MIFKANYGELGEAEARYNVKPREDLLDLLDTRPTRLLELGCADGTNLLFFKQRLLRLGVEVGRLVGVDAQRIKNCGNYGAFEFVHSTVENFIEGCRDEFDLVDPKEADTAAEPASQSVEPIATSPKVLH